MIEEGLIDGIKKKEAVFKSLLIHPKVKAVRSAGLLMAIEFADFDTNKNIIDRCLAKGVLTDWFLFAPHCMRIAPPLVISEEKIKTACGIIMEVINND